MKELKIGSKARIVYEQGEIDIDIIKDIESKKTSEGLKDYYTFLHRSNQVAETLVFSSEEEAYKEAQDNILKNLATRIAIVKKLITKNGMDDKFLLDFLADDRTK